MRPKGSYFSKQLESPLLSNEGRQRSNFPARLRRIDSKLPESPRKLSGLQRSKPPVITDPGYSGAKTEQLP
jgi:hypothetical protein